MPGGTRRLAAAALLLLTAVLTLFGPAATAQAAQPSVTFAATLAGRQVGSLTNNDPLVLRPDTPLVVVLTVTNHSATAATVTAARVNGTVMGLSFFNYDTQIGLVVPANGTATTRFSLGLTDLGGQADGRLPASISLLDAKADTIATHDFSVDVKGSLTSIFGIFGLAIAGITILWLVSLIYRLVTRTLPANRWTRAVQFSAAGFGVGLALTFSVSVLRLLTPGAAVWAPFVFGAGLIGFAVGYLTPGPRPRDDDADDERFAEEQARRPALAPVGAGAAVPVPAGSSPAGGELPSAEPLVDALPGREPPRPAPLPDPPAAAYPGGGRDTTVEADRSQLEQMFGPGYPGATGDESGRS